MPNDLLAPGAAVAAALLASPTEVPAPRTVAHEFAVEAPVEHVFPLFDAQHEAEWVEGWRFQPLAPTPYRTQPNAVFEVPHGDGTEFWVVLEFDPAAHRAEYLALRGRDLVRRVRVRCSPEGPLTRVAVSYTLTPLTPTGASGMARYDESFLRGWEEPVRKAAARRAGR
jgi:hypothetical protein